MEAAREYRKKSILHLSLRAGYANADSKYHALRFVIFVINIDELGY